MSPSALEALDVDDSLGLFNFFLYLCVCVCACLFASIRGFKSLKIVARQERNKEI